MKTTLAKASGTFLLSFILGTAAQATSTLNTLTYQGRIVKSDGTAFEYGSVNFLFEITSADGLCTIYREQKNGINMTGSEGRFDVPIGTGSMSFPPAPFSLSAAFDNSATLSCDGGSTYTPAYDDVRILKVQFYDGGGWQQITPNTEIRSVPFAFTAFNATKLGGVAATNYLKKPTAVCASGEALTYTAGGTSCVAVSTGGGGSGISNLGGLTDTTQSLAVNTTGTTLQWGHASATHTLSIPLASTAGVTSGLISKTDYDSFAAKAAASDVTALQTAVAGLIPYSQVPSCSTSQTWQFISPAGGFSCASIVVGTSQLSDGSVTAAKLNSAIGVWTAGSGNISYSGGNVGIGTSSPGYLLHVNGSLGAVNFYSASSTVSGGLAAYPVTTIQNTNATGYSGTMLLDSAGTSQGAFGYSNAGAGIMPGTLFMASLSTSPIAFGTSGGVERMRITSAGNVGIGTNAPGSLLEVNGDAKINTLTIGLGGGAGANVTSTALGLRALTSNVNGYSNTAVGANAMRLNVDGAFNTAVGQNSLNNNNGNGNTGVGYQAMNNGSTGNYNTALGYNAGSKVVGNNFTALGYMALINNNGGSGNTAVGASALLSSSSGSNNIALGYNAGAALTTQSNTLILGSNAGSTVLDGEVSISNGAGAERIRIDASGNVGIGTITPGYNLHVVGSAGLSSGTAWTLASDRRLKDIQGDYEYGLDEILKLHTVRFNYKKDNALGLPSENKLTGFIAQEVQQVIPDAVHERKDGYLELNADPIHWATVNAVQQLYGLCKASDEQLQTLTERLSNHERRIASLEEANQKLSEENQALREAVCEINPKAKVCR